METAVARFVVLNCRDQANGPFLEEVAKGDAPALAGLRGLKYEVQVVLDQDAVGYIAVSSMGRQEPALFLAGQAWIAPDLRLDLLLLILWRSLLNALGHVLILRTTGPRTGPMIKS